MRALSLAVRGLWWRRGSSVAIFLLAVVCAGVAAAGPAYLAGARDAVVQTVVRDADVSANGTGVSVSRPVTGTGAEAGPITADVAAGFAELVRARQLAAPIGSVAGVVHVPVLSNQGNEVRSPLVYRDGVCAHVAMRSGTCVTDRDPTGAIVTASAASALGVVVGSALPFADFGFRDPKLGPLRVRGIYEPLDPVGPYWFSASRGYFGQTSSTDAVLVPATTWVDASTVAADTVSAGADLALDPSGVRANTLASLAAGLQTATARTLAGVSAAVAAGQSTTTNLASVLFSAQQAEQSLAVPVATVAAQLVVLTVAVLFLVMVSSAESRAAELALGKLHGLRTRAAILHAVLEPSLLLVAAVPVGVGGCAVVLRGVAGHAFGPDALPAFGWPSWLAAVAAGVGGMAATLLAGASVLRRSVLEQWRRTRRRPGRRAWIVEAVVVALAVGGAIELTARPPQADGADVLPILAPALLAVACALLGARLLPLVARAGFGFTRGRRAVAPFVALRQLARRGDDARVFGLLCATVALLVFGLSSQTVFDHNRIDRARAEVGADRVVLLDDSAENTDVSEVVARLDPSGTQAAAVYQSAVTVVPPDQISGDGGGFAVSTLATTSMLVVDPARFAAVAAWRADYGTTASLARQLAPVAAGAPILPRFVGTSLHLAGTVRAMSGQPVDWHASVVDADGAQSDVDLGVLPTTGTTVPVDVTAAVPHCADGCTLRRFSVYGQASAQDPLVATVDLSTVAGVGPEGTTSALAALRTASWTALDPPDPGQPVIDAVRPSDTGLEIAVSAVGAPFDSDLGFGAQADVATVLPGLVTRSEVSTLPGQPVTVQADNQGPLAVRPTTVTTVPRVGDAGVLVSRDWIAASRPEGYAVFAPDQVWLAPDAPADFPARLTAAGLRIDGVETAASRAAVLSRQGPSFAVAMLTFGGVAAAVLAVAGAGVTLFVASRRRLFELAALRALGLRPSRMLASVVLEHAMVAAAASAAGFGAGLLGARLALATIPEFSDHPTFPAVLVDLPVGRTALASLGIAVAVGLVSGVGDLVLVRRADAGRLREAQA